jgi:hypothetical protein
VHLCLWGGGEGAERVAVSQGEICGEWVYSYIYGVCECVRVYVWRCVCVDIWVYVCMWYYVSVRVVMYSRNKGGGSTLKSQN